MKKKINLKCLHLLAQSMKWYQFQSFIAQQLYGVPPTVDTTHLTDKLFLYDVSGWVAYDWHKPETRPKAYGKYFVCRKDGKVHWETWNGSGWAYNGNVITHWQEVEPPCH